MRLPKSATRFILQCGETLCEMKKRGQFRSRYFRTNRDNDKYLIDVRGQEKEMSLYPAEIVWRRSIIVALPLRGGARCIS